MASKEELDAQLRKYLNDDKYHHDFEFRYEAMIFSAIVRDKNFDKSPEYRERLKKLLVYPSCIYCGQRNGNRQFMSIDCNVPKDGYTIANSVPCCLSCNIFKGTLTGEEYISKLNDFKKHDKNNHPLLK